MRRYLTLWHLAEVSRETRLRSLESIIVAWIVLAFPNILLTLELLAKIENSLHVQLLKSDICTCLR